MPPVSLCLLTYNRAPVLSRSLDSLLAQTYDDFELIINDDCSTDETQDVARRYVEADSRVKYFRNATNLRYSGNQNAAVARASGELIAIVHDGDIYRRDCVAKWVSALDAFPTAGIAFNASDGLNEDGVTMIEYRHPFPPLIRGKEMIDEMLRQNASPIFGIVMLRKSILAKAGQFSNRFPILADVDMWMRVLLISDAAYISEPLFQIYPRESDHVNRGVSWRVIEEQYQIFAQNLKRRFVDERQRADAERQLLKRHRRKIVRSCLWCLKRGKIASSVEGLRYLTRH